MNTRSRIQLRIQYFKEIAGLNRFLPLIASYLRRNVFIIPRNFTAMSRGVDLNEILFLAQPRPRARVTSQSRSRGLTALINQITGNKTSKNTESTANIVSDNQEKTFK